MVHILSVCCGGVATRGTKGRFTILTGAVHEDEAHCEFSGSD